MKVCSGSSTNACVSKEMLHTCLLPQVPKSDDLKLGSNFGRLFKKNARYFFMLWVFCFFIIFELAVVLYSFVATAQGN